jgi:hypothetical protein
VITRIRFAVITMENVTGRAKHLISTAHWMHTQETADDSPLLGDGHNAAPASAASRQLDGEAGHLRIELRPVRNQGGSSDTSRRGQPGSQHDRRACRTVHAAQQQEVVFEHATLFPLRRATHRAPGVGARVIGAITASVEHRGEYGGMMGDRTKRRLFT